MIIKSVRGRQVLDSRGFPTVEVDVALEGGAWGRFIVPSGASTGRFEAVELRDRDFAEYGGMGVRQAVYNVNHVIAPAVVGLEALDQAGVDRVLLELDGTSDKRRLGANALLGVSGAVSVAAAQGKEMPLYAYLAGLHKGSKPGNLILPMPMVNILSGGLHAGRQLDIQDFLFVPKGAKSYSEAMEWVHRVYQAARTILAEEGLPQSLVADEGGLGPTLSSNEAGLKLLTEAIGRAGLDAGVEGGIAVDVAASHFYRRGRYHWVNHDLEFSREEMIEILVEWVDRYPIVSVEDGLAEDDWEGWQLLTKALGTRVQILGDDLFVTSPERIQKGIAAGVANAVLIKVNQIGTITEALGAVQMAQKACYNTVVSARSGETEDTFIADLAVAVGPGQIKVGSITRSERLAKYNRLFRIAEDLGPRNLAHPFG